MSVATHTYVVGEIFTASTANTYIRDNLADLQSNKVNMKTGTYTGDGTTSQEITGIGFAISYIKIWENELVHDGATHVYETTSDYVDNHADGLCIRHNTGGGHVAVKNAIIALGSDSFTVDDAGGDGAPNKNGQEYIYYCQGVG